MKKSNKLTAFVLSVMMVFALTPSFAFAETAEETDTTEFETETTEPVETVEETEKAAEPEDNFSAQASYLKKGEFKDTGSEYNMEDISGYSSKMRIYAFYLGTGEAGDAVLIESNGKYLLMDTGMKDSSTKLISCLKAVMGSEKKLDIYFSHMHGDHTGGLESVIKNYKVGTVFFPDIELCKNYLTPNTDKSIDQIYAEHVAIAKKEAKVVYLRPDSSVRSSKPRAKYTASKFSVGGVTFKVLGPLGTYKPEDFTSYVKELNGYCGTKEGHCLNNSSMCTMVKCGKIRYLSTGDIEKQEEAKLIKKYGDELNCNILKLPHHGLQTSCTTDFAKKTTPMWSFEQNHGFTVMVPKAINTAKKYGFNYAVASKKHGIIYDVSNNKVRVYRDNNDNCKADDGLLKGWISCGGGKQYYSQSGYIKTGWKWISGHAYYMGGKSGFRYTGSHKINGTKVKFDSDGKLISHKKPSKVTIRYATAKSDGKIKVKWAKAYRASRYQIYRAASKSGTYTKIKTVSSKARSYTNSGLEKGKTYYYKVRAIRYVAGGTMYGSFSKIKSAKAK